MKILYVITSTDTGGAEKALCALAVQTKEQGNEVRVLCLKPLGPVASELEKAGISVKEIGIKSPGKTIKKIRAEIELFKPALVHAMLFRAIEFTRMACAGTGVKLVTTPHFDLSKKNFLLRLADRFLKEKDTLSVAESFSTMQYLINYQGYDPDKVYLLPNGVDKSRFYKDQNLRASMRQKQSFHVKTVVFICVARLAPVKDPMTLLKAFRNVWMRNSNVRLVYVGEGKERSSLERYIRQSKMQEPVLLAGEQEDINGYLNMADVFVLPSIEESLPLSLLEALQVGLPCIVSHVGDMPRWVEHGKNGYVFAPGDVSLLSCFMDLIAQNEKERLGMGQNALEKAAHIMDPLTQYQQIYQQLINGKFSREN